MKKLLCVILSLLMLLSISPIAAMASDTPTLYIYSRTCPDAYTEYAQAQLPTMLASPEYEDATNATLGVPFTFANQTSNIFYFPIFSNGAILYTLRVFEDTDGTISGILSPSLASDLSRYIGVTSNQNPLSILFENNTILFEHDGSQEIVFRYPTDLGDESVEMVTAAIASDFSVIECTPVNEIEIPQIRAAASSHMIALFRNVANVTTQGSDSWCVAYAGAAIISYLGTPTTAAEIANDYGLSPSEALAESQLINYAQGCDIWPTQSSSPLTFTQYTQEIDRNQPVYLRMQRTVTGGTHTYHAIVLRGYNYGTMSVWNPWHNFYETVDSLTHYVPVADTSRVYVNVDCIYNWQ